MSEVDSAVRYVDHTYRDYSTYIEDGGTLIKHKKCEANFPHKVHKMLSDPRHGDVVTWMPHGRAWKILDKERLISSALPEYMVCRKFESFTRQLNAWGFKRLYQLGPDFGGYYHEAFLRAKPKLTVMIRRVPPNQGKAVPFAAGEPNFYRISEQYPLPLHANLNASATTPAQELGESSRNDSQRLSTSSTRQSHQESLADLAEAAAAAIPPHMSQLDPPGFEPIRVAAAASDIPSQYNLHRVATAASDVPSQYNLHIQHPSLTPTRSSAQNHAVRVAWPATVLQTPSQRSPQYSQPLGHNAYSASPYPLPYPQPRYPSNYPQQYYDYSRQYPYNDYNHYLTHPSQYQQQSPELPRFRYPPPQPLSNYRYPVANIAPLIQHVPRSTEVQAVSHRDYARSHESNFSSETFRPEPPVIHKVAIQDLRLRQEEIEPIPYGSPPLDEESISTKGDPMIEEI